MSVAFLFGGIILVIFISVFLSSRRFGVLALSLAAGSVLSGLWAGWLADMLTRYGITFDWLPVNAFAIGLLLMLPLVLMLFKGPKHPTTSGKIISAVAIGLLTAAFLVQPLGRHMVLEGDALAVYQWIAEYWQYVVTVGLSLGVVDVLLMSTKRPDKDKSKKH